MLIEILQCILGLLFGTAFVYYNAIEVGSSLGRKKFSGCVLILNNQKWLMQEIIVQQYVSGKGGMEALK